MGEKINKSNVLDLIERLKNSGMGKAKALNYMQNVVQYKMNDSFVQELPKKLNINEDVKYTDNRDCIFTKLILDDNNWMTYNLHIEIPLRGGDLLIAEFQYFGTTISWLKIMVNDERREFSFSSDIFKDYLSKYMTQHINSLVSPYAFDGENIAIEFWNEVMNNYTSINYDEECSFEKL